MEVLSEIWSGIKWLNDAIFFYFVETVLKRHFEPFLARIQYGQLPPQPNLITFHISALHRQNQTHELIIL